MIRIVMRVIYKPSAYQTQRFSTHLVSNKKVMLCLQSNKSSIYLNLIECLKLVMVLQRYLFLIMKEHKC